MPNSKAEKINLINFQYVFEITLNQLLHVKISKWGHKFVDLVYVLGSNLGGYFENYSIAGNY